MEKNFNVLLEEVAHELKFWKGFVQTTRFLDGWVANIKTPELQQSVYDFIKGKDAKILDVGSGVVSILNGTPCYALNSVDLLGNLYPFIFDYEKHGVKQPVAVAGEYILDKVQADFYDIVHMSNAIDHSVDPELVFSNLVACCKPGGYIILQGFEDEGDFEQFEGMHQWNIHIDEDETGMHAGLIVQDKIKEIDLLLTYHLQVESLSIERIRFEEKTWYIWIGQKIRE